MFTFSEELSIIYQLNPKSIKIEAAKKKKKKYCVHYSGSQGGSTELEK